MNELRPAPLKNAVLSIEGEYYEKEKVRAAVALALKNLKNLKKNYGCIEAKAAIDRSAKIITISFPDICGEEEVTK